MTSINDVDECTTTRGGVMRQFAITMTVTEGGGDTAEKILYTTDYVDVAC